MTRKLTDEALRYALEWAAARALRSPASSVRVIADEALAILDAEDECPACQGLGGSVCAIHGNGTGKGVTR